METEVKQETYENIIPILPPKPKRLTKDDASEEDGKSGKDLEPYESIKCLNIDVNAKENQAIDIIKPKIPPRGLSKDNDIPLEPLNTKENVTSGKDLEPYESIECLNIDVNAKENQAIDIIKPETPPRGLLKNNDIPLEQLNIMAPDVDNRHATEPLIQAIPANDTPRRNTRCTAICKHKKRNACFMLSGIIIGFAIGFVIGFFSFADRNKDANLQNYVLPMTPLDVDQLYKLYITPQKKENASAVISFVMAEKLDSMYDKTSTKNFNIMYALPNGKTALFNSSLYQGKAYASKISSDNKVTNIYQKAGSDSFFVLPERLLDTRYTIASVGHKINEHNICNQRSFIYAEELEKLTYTNGISPTVIQMEKFGNEEKENVTIKATKFVSVLNMYKCIGPLFSKLCDTSYEQVIPDKYLGDEYFVPSFDTQQNINYSSYIIITSPVNDNAITYLHGNEGSEETINLKEGEAYKFTKTPAIIRCKKTCSVSVLLQFQNKFNSISIAMTNIIATKHFLTDTSYFSADMSETTWPNLHLFIVIAPGESKMSSSKISLDGQQMQSKWRTPSGLGFTFGVTTALLRKTHYLKSEGLPYMGYLVGTNSSSCGFAHFIGLNI